MEDILCLPIKVFTSNILVQYFMRRDFMYVTLMNDKYRSVKLLCYDGITIIAYRVDSINGCVIAKGEYSDALHELIDNVIDIYAGSTEFINNIKSLNIDILDVCDNTHDSEYKYYTLKRLIKYAKQLIRIRDLDIFNLKISELVRKINTNNKLLDDYKDILTYKINVISGVMHCYIIIKLAIKRIAIYTYCHNGANFANLNTNYEHIARIMLYTTQSVYTEDLFNYSPQIFVEMIDKIADLPKNSRLRIFRDYDPNNTMRDYAST